MQTNIHTPKLELGSETKVDVNLLFNNKGTKYKQLGLKELNLDDSGKLEWLKKDNMLFKRPVIVYGENLEKVLCAYDGTIYEKEFYRLVLNTKM